MSVAGNLLGLSGHRYPPQEYKLGGLTFRFLDELDVRDEYLRRSSPERREALTRAGKDVNRCNGFFVPAENLIVVELDWNGKVPALETLGHEVLHALKTAAGEAWEE